LHRHGGRDKDNYGVFYYLTGVLRSNNAHNPVNEYIVNANCLSTGGGNINKDMAGWQWDFCVHDKKRNIVAGFCFQTHYGQWAYEFSSSRAWQVERLYFDRRLYVARQCNNYLNCFW